MKCPCPNDDEKGAEIFAGVLHKREPRSIGYTADRTSTMEFPNLSSNGIARLYEDHCLAVSLRENGEALRAR